MKLGPTWLALGCEKNVGGQNLTNQLLRVSASTHHAAYLSVEAVEKVLEA